MHDIQYTTTITHTIKFGDDGRPTDIEHAVHIDASDTDGMPEMLVYMIALAGLKAGVYTISAEHPEAVVPTDEEYDGEDIG